jgi:hypothetical protein
VPSQKNPTSASPGSTSTTGKSVVTNLQAIAVRLTLDKTITIRSIYIPPNHQLQFQELINF